MLKRRRAAQDRRDRTLLALLGVLLLALAVVGVLLSTRRVERIGELRSDGPVLSAQFEAVLRANLVWWQFGVFAVGMLLTLLGLWWLRRLMPRLRHHRDHVLPATGRYPGETTVSGGALAGALEQDLTADPHVHAARAEIRADGEAGRTDVRVRVDADDRLTVPELVETVIRPAAGRLAQRAGLPDPIVETEVRLTSAEQVVA